MAAAPVKDNWVQHVFKRDYDHAGNDIGVIPLILAQEDILTEDSFREGRVLRFAMSVDPKSTGDLVKGPDIFWYVQGNPLDYPMICICVILEDGSYQYLGSISSGTKTFWHLGPKYGFRPLKVRLEKHDQIYKYKDGHYQ